MAFRCTCGAKIFGRFVRLGLELEREKPGTGLGLYIARTLVRRLPARFACAIPKTAPAPSSRCNCRENRRHGGRRFGR